MVVPGCVAGRKPQRFSTGTPSPLISERTYFAESLLARDERVAVVVVLHVALLQVVRGADVVVRPENDARSLASEERAQRLDLLGRGLLFGDHMVEPEDHQRVGVGEDPLVDRQFLSGLIDALVDGHGLARYLADDALKAQQRKVKQLQRSLDALKEHLSE